MTGGFSQMMRAYEALAADAPLADRWDIRPVQSRCVRVDSDKITDMTLEQWRAEMALKYGEDGL